MLIVSAATANAMAPHTGERSWVMFVQETGGDRIWIEGVIGSQIGRRLDELARFNAFDTFLIGLVETATPAEHARAIREQYGKPIHNYWHEPTADLLAFVQHVAQPAIRQLIDLTHPGALSTGTVGVEELMQILNVSESTIRRMVKAGEIPHYRFGRVLRFVPAEVVASLQRRPR